MNATLPMLSTHLLDNDAADRVDIAFARLADFLNAEAESLRRLARLLGLPEIPSLLKRTGLAGRRRREPYPA